MKNQPILYDNSKNRKSMNTAIKIILVLATVILASFAVNAQAELTIQNNSQRTMTVKVMKGYGEDGSLHKNSNYFTIQQ